MSKLNFSKLGLKKLNKIKTLEYGENIIEVKQYLPVEEKLNLIADVITFSLDDNNFANPLKIDAYTNLAIVENYTNITFTEKQKDEAPKTFDLIEENGLIDFIIKEGMDPTEYKILIDAIDETIKSFYSYKNSLYGIMETITTDYEDLNLEGTELIEKLSDPNQLGLLKDIVTKLG